MRTGLAMDLRVGLWYLLIYCGHKTAREADVVLDNCRERK